MNLSHKIEVLMAEMRISASELAINANIERSTLTRILNGSTVNPRIETLQNLAEYFKVDISEFTTFKENEHGSTKTIISKIMLELMTNKNINSIQTLACETGLAFSIVSDIINGKTAKPSIKTLTKLSSYLNVSVAYLLGIDEQITEPIVQKLPLIPSSEIENYLNGNSSVTNKFISVEGSKLHKNAFAIIIDEKLSANFDIQYNNTLILDTITKANDNDYVIMKIKNKYMFGKYSSKKTPIIFHHLTTNKQYCFDSSCIIVAIVIQQIINFRQFNALSGE